MTDPARPGPATLDVLGIGNAIVDILADADELLIERLALPKGSMTLIDEARMAEIYAAMGPAREVSGGSCANTMAAVASLGGAAGYIGRVKDDALGQVFAHDMRAGGVRFDSLPSRDGPPTARCHIFVTGDAQRTMATYLGACVELGPADVDEHLVGSAAVTYLEGYLWDRPDAKAACRKAAGIAHAQGRKLALTLSDSFCVGRWRDEFLTLVRGEVDILFANEAEITALYQTESLAEAVAALCAEVPLAAVTRSEKGSLVLSGDAVHEIPAAPVARLVDTTGAGDLYAAGFLRGLTAGLPLPRCGALGSAAAAAVLGIYGPRPAGSLAPLMVAATAA